jgi:hypothetical protein
MTIMVPKDSKGNALYSQSMQGMDPKYPQHGLSYDHIMPQRNEIIDSQKHPANNLPTPAGGGNRPVIGGKNKVYKKAANDSTHFGRGNTPVGQSNPHGRG